jgi:hypothetical protein
MSAERGAGCFHFSDRVRFHEVNGRLWREGDVRLSLAPWLWLSFANSCLAVPRKIPVALVQTGGANGTAKSKQKPLFISVFQQGGANPSLSASRLKAQYIIQMQPAVR